MNAWARALLTVATLATSALASSVFAPRVLAAHHSPTDSLAHLPPTLLAGDYWTHLSPADKQVYLSGFLAGAGAEQARAAVAGVHADDDTAAVAGALESLRTRHALRFTFVPQVYAAQLDDFYWWSNHATVPIVDALIMVNAVNVHHP